MIMQTIIDPLNNNVKFNGKSITFIKDTNTN